MFDYTTFLRMLGTAVYTLIAVCSFKTLRNMQIRESGEPNSLVLDFFCAVFWPIGAFLIGFILLIFDAGPVGFKHGKQKE